MRRSRDSERRHVMLRLGDFDKLRALFPRAGPSTVIRQVVANLVDTLEQENYDKALKPIEEISDDIRTIVDEYIQYDLGPDSEPVDPGESEEPDGAVRGAPRHLD